MCPITAIIIRYYFASNYSPLAHRMRRRDGQSNLRPIDRQITNERCSMRKTRKNATEAAGAWRQTGVVSRCNSGDSLGDFFNSRVVTLCGIIGSHAHIFCSDCGLRPSILGQDRSEIRNSVLVLVSVLRIWSYLHH